MRYPKLAYLSLILAALFLYGCPQIQPTENQTVINETEVNDTIETYSAIMDRIKGECRGDCFRMCDTDCIDWEYTYDMEYWFNKTLNKTQFKKTCICIAEKVIE